MTNQNLLALTMASAMATSSSGPSPTTGTRFRLRARTTQVRANPDDDSDLSSSKEKPRVATASKRKHDGSGDDSEDNDPPSKKRKCGRRSHELCSDCVSGDSRRHASQRNVPRKPKQPPAKRLAKKKKRGRQAADTAAHTLPPVPQPPKKRVGSFQSHDISAIFDEPLAAEILREVEKSAIHLKKHGKPRDYTPPEECKKYYATGNERLSFEYAKKDLRVSIYYLCCYCLYINLAMC